MNLGYRYDWKPDIGIGNGMKRNPDISIGIGMEFQWYRYDIDIILVQYRFDIGMILVYYRYDIGILSV